MKKTRYVSSEIPVVNKAKQATIEKCDTDVRALAEQYSSNILKNWMILSLNILINKIFIEKV